RVAERGNLVDHPVGVGASDPLHGSRRTSPRQLEVLKVARVEEPLCEELVFLADLVIDFSRDVMRRLTASDQPAEVVAQTQAAPGCRVLLQRIQVVRRGVRVDVPHGNRVEPTGGDAGGQAAIRISKRLTNIKARRWIELGGQRVIDAMAGYVRAITKIIGSLL